MISSEFGNSSVSSYGFFMSGNNILKHQGLFIYSFIFDK